MLPLRCRSMLDVASCAIGNCVLSDFASAKRKLDESLSRIGKWDLEELVGRKGFEHRPRDYEYTRRFRLHSEPFLQFSSQRCDYFFFNDTATTETGFGETRMLRGSPSHSIERSSTCPLPWCETRIISGGSNLFGRDAMDRTLGSERAHTWDFSFSTSMRRIPTHSSNGHSS